MTAGSNCKLFLKSSSMSTTLANPNYHHNLQFNLIFLWWNHFKVKQSPPARGRFSQRAPRGRYLFASCCELPVHSSACIKEPVTPSALWAAREIGWKTNIWQHFSPQSCWFRDNQTVRWNRKASVRVNKTFYLLLLHTDKHLKGQEMISEHQTAGLHSFLIKGASCDKQDSAPDEEALHVLHLINLWTWRDETLLHMLRKGAIKNTSVCQTVSVSSSFHHVENRLRNNGRPVR